MADNPDQIKKHIESAQSELGGNFQELEDKVKRAADWHVQFDKHPMGMLGIALGAGMLLSAVVGGSRSPRRHSSDRDMELGRATSGASEQRRQKTSQTWDNITGALAGMAVASLRMVLGEAIPGFKEHYDRRERAAGQSYGPTAAVMDHEVIH
jgi:hypothetical protein